MFVPTITHRRRRAREGLASIAVLTALLSALLLDTAAPATATEVDFRDHTAPVETVGPMLVGKELIDTSPGGYAVEPWIAYGGVTVGASRASSEDQRVTVLSVLERFDGAIWQVVDFHVQMGEVKGFETTTLGRWGYTIEDETPHLYRVTYHIGWSDLATGDSLATATVKPSSEADSLCQTVKVSCEETADGLVRI